MITQKLWLYCSGYRRTTSNIFPMASSHVTSVELEVLYHQDCLAVLIGWAETPEQKHQHKWWGPVWGTSRGTSKVPFVTTGEWQPYLNGSMWLGLRIKPVTYTWGGLKNKYYGWDATVIRFKDKSSWREASMVGTIPYAVPTFIQRKLLWYMRTTSKTLVQINSQSWSEETSTQLLPLSCLIFFTGLLEEELNTHVSNNVWFHQIGACGETKEHLEKLLSYPEDVPCVHAALKNLQKSEALALASAIFHQPSEYKFQDTPSKVWLTKRCVSSMYILHMWSITEISKPWTGFASKYKMEFTGN